MPGNHESRKSIRTQASIEDVSGMFENTTTRQSQPLVVVNISNEGLCLHSSEPMGSNDIINIFVTSPLLLTSKCCVQWCKKSDDGYIVGLRTLDSVSRFRALHDSILINVISKAG